MFRITTKIAIMDSGAYSQWAVCGWHSLCAPALPAKSMGVSWVLGAAGLKLSFATGLLVGLLLGCAAGAFLRSYFVIFHLAFALGVLGLVWLI